MFRAFLPTRRALCLLLAAVFQPSWMRHAIKASAKNSGVVEVCTGTGMKWIDLASGEVRDPPTDSMPGTALDHCPCCTSQAASMPPSLLSPRVVDADLSDSLPFLYWHSPRPLFAWTHASPRGPPARA